jgi:hypothetical protein
VVAPALTRPAPVAPDPIALWASPLPEPSYGPELLAPAAGGEGAGFAVILRFRVEIAWRVVDARPASPAPAPLRRPSLNELRTEDQVLNHFVAFPRVIKNLEAWLSGERDLLFLGLPFCGKSSLLSFLAFEASRRRRDSLLPIFLYPRSDLAPDDIGPAVAQLQYSLRQSGLLQQGRLPILMLDNLHEAANFEIARRLMSGARPWRIWAAARR